MSSMSYLEKLLDGVEVEWKELGDEIFVEIANSGRKPVKSSLRTSGKVPYYGANNIQERVASVHTAVARVGSAPRQQHRVRGRGTAIAQRVYSPIN